MVQKSLFKNTVLKSRKIDRGKRAPRICMLGASFGTNNLGVNALTAGSLKAYYDRFPDGELFLLDYGKKEIKHTFRTGVHTIPVELVNIRFSKKFYLKNNIAFLVALALLARCITSRRLRAKVIFKNYWLARMAGADVIVSMAGGDSFSDVYGITRFLYVSLPQILALLLGKKLVLMPQTIGPFHGLVAKTVARSILRRASMIYSRDHEGVGETAALLGTENADGKVRFCNDVGFVVDPARPDVIDLAGLPEQGTGDAPLVGLNVSGLLYKGGYAGENMFGLRVDYRALVDELIAFFINKKNANVLLVPHVYGAGEASESDAAVCKRIYEAGKAIYPGRLFLARGEYDQHEIKYIIGLCDFFVGSRMHACIAALSQNVPAVGIAYSRKFIGVLRTVGAEALVADPRKHGKEEILSLVDTAFEDRDQVRRRLQQRMPQVREKVLTLFKEIEEIMRP